MVFISIEGNIGSGKSTLMKYIEDNIAPSKCRIDYEALNLWQNFKGKNLLNKCYSGEPFELQCLIPFTRVRNLNKFKNIITERSCHSDSVFADTWKAQGCLDELHHGLNIYMNERISELSRKPDIFIYLRTKPKECLEQCNKRNRFEEKQIELPFLETIDFYLEKRMKELAEKYSVICVDGHLKTEEICEYIFGQILKEEGKYFCKWCDHKTNHLGNIKKHMMTKSHLFNNPLPGYNI